ncbi:glutamyl-tRNA synthetase [Candidatus Termititenax persephonae]|uniref:Glutamate--tRNA ligase n=1 Tax=Candidatus Termititenax persephonae TaxID=2218525 RepID=A0A388THX7_9BACT|nr:glutamyl-tRNA synthetase [Candidatus Termititenax persephonae]
MSESEIRTRFAPSPTGYLHVGGARTALFNWLYARKNNGEFILRIEDTDRARSTPEAIQAILNGLRWLGLDWDEGPEVGGAYGPYFQTQRLELYNQYLNELLDKKAAYAKDGAVYFKSTDPDGHIEDFVIRRSDGMPVYNYAVVIDDALMRITHIIRGDDHLSNTPRQVMIYKALNFAVPKIVHVPMILGGDGQRLSKRHGATSVEEYAKQGILPEAMVNYLARLGWSYKDQEFFTRADLLDKFSLNKVGKAAAIFDNKKLAWLNAEHIKKAPPSRLKDFLPPEYLQHPKIDKILALSQSRLKTTEHIVKSCAYFIEPDVDIPAELQSEADSIKEYRSALAERLKNIDWQIPSIEQAVRGFAAEQNLDAAKIIMPLRIILTGSNVSPGIFEVLELLGQDLTVRRLNK